MSLSDPAIFLRLRQAFEDGGDRRSPLYRWMWTNADVLSALFDGARINWKRLTVVFREMGFLNGYGAVLSPETVRQTWYRVRRRRGVIGTKRRAATGGPVRAPAEGRSLTVMPEPERDEMAESVEEILSDVMAELSARSGRIHEPKTRKE